MVPYSLGSFGKLTAYQLLSHAPEVADSWADSRLLQWLKPRLRWPSGPACCRVSWGLPDSSPPFLPPHLQGTKVHILPFLYLRLQITFISMHLIVWQFGAWFECLSRLSVQFIVRYLSSKQNLESRGYLRSRTHSLEIAGSKLISNTGKWSFAFEYLTLSS